MITFNGWLVSFVSAVLLAVNAWASDFSYELSPGIIEPGQRAILELRLKRGETERTAVIEDTLLTKSPGFKILESDYDDSGEILIWRYQITSYQAGDYRIPPVELKYGPATYSTEARTLSVVSGRSPEDMSLRPAFGKVSLPVRWDRWLPWLFSAIGIVLAYLLFRRYLQPHLSRWLASPGLGLLLRSHRETPHQWLARQLRRIRHNIERSRGKAYWLDDLTDVLREYFSRQYGRPARSWTIREMASEMGSIPAVREIVEHVIAKSDELRFSGDPDRENADIVRALLENSEKALLKCGN